MCHDPNVDPRDRNELSESKIDAPGRKRRRKKTWRRIYQAIRLTFLRFWRLLNPQQKLVVGFLSYVIIGVALLSLPFAQEVHVSLIDNLFSVTSAMSTTGLVTVSTGDSYTFFGEMVHLILFQLGGIGYMTLTSFLILTRGRKLGRSRKVVLEAGFALPHYFRIDHFVRQVIVFTLVAETIGALLLWRAFASAGAPNPLWTGIFHSVSAFATAGFSLYSSSLEAYRDNLTINLVIGALSYLGAIGFIVFQDVYYSIIHRERMVTFTSKVILTMTAMILLIGSPIIYFVEPSIREFDTGHRILASLFQTMTASTTAGFNTIPIGTLGMCTLWIITIAMLIGASPSGTGGGIKTTSVSALLAVLISSLRGRKVVSLLGNEIPPARILVATSATSLYLIMLAIGVLLLSLTEASTLVHPQFLSLLFEAASALGTVGLSMGVTPNLSLEGKIIVIALMFLGRIGPLTLGLALLKSNGSKTKEKSLRSDDLAT